MDGKGNHHASLLLTMVIIVLWHSGYIILIIKSIPIKQCIHFIRQGKQEQWLGCAALNSDGHHPSSSFSLFHTSFFQHFYSLSTVTIDHELYCNNTNYASQHIGSTETTTAATAFASLYLGLLVYASDTWSKDYKLRARHEAHCSILNGKYSSLAFLKSEEARCRVKIA